MNNLLNLAPSSPLVSVGIPTYNRARTLKKAVNSILGQDYPNIELIISDNASTDDTEMYCRAELSGYSQVKYLRAGVNKGPTANFIECLKNADGEFFMWLADDDWVDANYVSSCVAALQQDPKLVLACGFEKCYREGAEIRNFKSINVNRGNGYLRMVRYYLTMRDNSIFYGVMRRSVAMRVPFRNCMANDWIFVANMAYQGGLVTLKNTSIHRERGGTSASARNIARTLKLSPSAGRFPFWFAAMGQARDVFASDSIHAKKSYAARLGLAASLFPIIAIYRNFIRYLISVESRLSH